MKQQKIVVFGSYIADLITHCNRLPTIGETIKASSFNMGLEERGLTKLSLHKELAQMFC